MSTTKINLEIQTKIDLGLISEGIKLHLVRFLASVRLERDNGWTENYIAIMDTGNPVSIVPKFVWNNTKFKVISPKKADLYGIGPIPIKGVLGEIALVLEDEKSVSPAMNIKAYLLDDNKVPFLIGIEDFLTGSKLVTDIPNDTAYIEFGTQQ